MIDNNNCIANANGNVKARSNEGEKKANVEKLHRRGFTIDDCARLTFDGTIPTEGGETHDARFGDATHHAREMARWQSWVRRVERWVEEASSAVTNEA